MILFYYIFEENQLASTFPKSSLQNVILFFVWKIDLIRIEFDLIKPSLWVIITVKELVDVWITVFLEVE